jgi:predicted chitinase
MNLLGEGFNPNILGQIDARQKVFASGYNNLRSPEYIAYANSDTSFLKMMSSVSINNLDVVNNSTIKSLGLTGNKLAKQAILFGGVKKFEGNIQGGILNTNSTSVFNNFAYGWGGTEYGLRPMPGLLSATIKSENIGSLKTATINIKAWSRTQFEIIDVLYLRLGYYVALEWGHVIYVDNNGTIQTNPYSLETEFFGDNTSVDQIQKSIIKKRYDSFGNYDAMLGRVVNFSWTFEDDGSYNITVIVRSIGDIIESLKMNILTTSPVPNSPFITQNKIQQQNQQQQNQSYAPAQPTAKSLSTDPYPNKSNIHIRLNKLKELVDTEKNGSATTSLSNNELIDIRRVNWDGETNGPVFYIRFGAFLKLLEEEVIPNFSKGSTTFKAITFDNDVKSNIINFIDAQVSTDPRKILIEREFNIDGETIKILPGVENFITKISDQSYGQLMNIYINFDYILSLLDQLTQQISNKVILIDYLKNIGATISNCLGSINNITPVIDDDTNTIKFIDQNPLYNRTSVLTSFSLPTVPGIFDLYGYSPNKYEQSGSAGFIKEFTMKTELTSQFASMISTGAAARSKVVGEDATALSRLNAGLESSLLETITDPNLDYNTSSSLETQYPDAVTNYYNFIKSMNMFPSKPKWNEADFDIYTSVLNTFINYVQQSNYIKDKKATTSTGFIPINVSLRMFGMSGMKIYQEFTLNTDYLPSNYEREMSWLIKGVTHTIENNSWTTTIESLSIPKTVTKPLEEDFRISKIINENLPNLPNLGEQIPESYRNIVEKIINRAKQFNIIDRSRLTAILTVARAESNFRPTITENLNYNVSTPEGIARVKSLFSKLRGKPDVEIRNIFATPQSTANFLYAVPGGGPNDGYNYRGRGLTQITFKINYQTMQKYLSEYYPYLDIVKNPDNAAKEAISIDILILGKINGVFGEALTTNIDYTTNAIAIVKTQNRAAVRNKTIIHDYTKALNSINNTEWIQKLLR